MAETFPLDTRGHLFSREPIEAVTVHHFGDHVMIVEAGLMAYYCTWCDASRDLKLVDGTVQQPEPCPHPDGITTTVTLAVPSGEIVVYDDLRDTYRLPGSGEGSAGYNSVLGQHQVIEAYAAQGMAYGPVGNSCPDLYRTGEGTYVIACPEYADDGDGRAILPGGWTREAGITTDLWAYSIADLADYRARGGVLDMGSWSGPSVVSVPPGTYRFTHHTGEKGFDRDAPGTTVYAHIERCSDPA